MKIKYYALIFLALLLSINACKKDDDDSVVSIPPRDRGEQQEKDKDSLIGYLETHYYNSSNFTSNTNPSINDLIISKLPSDGVLPDPINNTLLIDAVEVKNTDFAEVDYEYYILRLNQGGGTERPHFSDKIRVNYSGNLLNEEIFDSSVNPVEFDLTGVIVGWSRVIPEFNIAEFYTVNQDGTVSFTNTGVGVMFLPSGLAYFSEGASGIPVYASLIFKFELYQSNITDHDNDGIPSYLEDIDNNLILVDDDTDNNGVPNFVDGNDDGDDILTINELEHLEYIVNTNEGETEPVLASDEFEISRSESNGIITINTVKIVDSNNDGLADYLDPDIAVNNSGK